ncbi:Vsp/OspC family lipoprotein (plasmid) [Borrelia miyamotoi]|uniref:Vsp/OspC family lipoprotein n=1 Tax=Borrelia miyamotoi TaxID=47466 RepID=UPI0022B59F37|nr:Vsp/OspC family lipoprotein [Borrelia miyamotoi]WAZ71159.1 Vsp/OspC family lipoprotein [Borrelia miyamotoi]
MTLFLIINIVMISCGSGGPAPKEGQAAKADGTVIDLAKVSKKIKDVVEFATSVKEIHTLVKSVDELAKAIGKKIKQNSEELEVDNGKNNKNGELVAGAFQVILTVKDKLEKLGNIPEISEELKGKVTDSKNKCKEFVDKVKADSDISKAEATDEHVKKAIDQINTPSGEKGGAELVKLNKSIDDLLIAANNAVNIALVELTTPDKVATSAKKN